MRRGGSVPCSISRLASAVSRAVAYSSTTALQREGALVRFQRPERREGGGAIGPGLPAHREQPRRDQHRQQFFQTHRLAQDSKPEKHCLLNRREALELLVQQFPHASENHLALFQERGDLARKSSTMVCATIFKANGLPAYVSARRARSCTTPTTSSRPTIAPWHRPPTPQAAKYGPATCGPPLAPDRSVPPDWSERDDSDDLCFPHPPQQPSIAFKARTHATPALAFEDHLQIVQHQQRTPVT